MPDPGGANRTAASQARSAARPPATGRRRRPEAAPARTPPARPRLDSDLAPPVGIPAPPRPRALTVSAVLWCLACLAGAAGIALALADGDALREKLRAAALESRPDAAEDTLADAVRVTQLLVLGAVALLVLVALLGVRLALRRRSWSRWLLLVVGVLTLLAADLAQDMVSGGRDADRVLFLVQAGLVVAALVPLFLPSSRGWLRGGPAG